MRLRNLSTKYVGAGRLRDVTNNRRAAARFETSQVRQVARKNAYTARRQNLKPPDSNNCSVVARPPFLAGGHTQIPSLSNMPPLPLRSNAQGSSKEHAVPARVHMAPAYSSAPMTLEQEQQPPQRRTPVGGSRLGFIPRKCGDLKRFRSVNTKVAALLSSPMIAERPTKTCYSANGAESRSAAQVDVDAEHLKSSADNEPTLTVSTLRRSMRIAAATHRRFNDRPAHLDGSPAL